MEFTLPMAIALVGSVGTLSLTIYKILSLRKTSGNGVSRKEFEELKSRNAVQDEQIKELTKDFNRLQNLFDKLNDLMIKLLKGE